MLEQFIFVKSFSNVTPRKLIEEIISNNNCSIPIASTENAEEESPLNIDNEWCIDTKYYTSTVLYRYIQPSIYADSLPVETRRQQSLVISRIAELECSNYFSAQALIFIIDTSKLKSFKDMTCWLSATMSSSEYNKTSPPLESTLPSIKLLVCECLQESDEVSKESLQLWCLEKEFEIIELNPLSLDTILNDGGDDFDDDVLLETEDMFKETRGIERIVEALECHLWPNMILKDRKAKKKIIYSYNSNLSLLSSNEEEIFSEQEKSLSLTNYNNSSTEIFNLENITREADRKSLSDVIEKMDNREICNRISRSTKEDEKEIKNILGTIVPSKKIDGFSFDNASSDKHINDRINGNDNRIQNGILSNINDNCTTIDAINMNIDDNNLVKNEDSMCTDSNSSAAFTERGAHSYVKDEIINLGENFSNDNFKVAKNSEMGGKKTNSKNESELNVDKGGKIIDESGNTEDGVGCVDGNNDLEEDGGNNEETNMIEHLNFENLFQQIPAMKEKASKLPYNQRKKYAETVVLDFWKAIGGDPEDIEGLSLIDDD